ncbi:protein BZR1 homolog 4-like [Impatiens glandulifera]|uniref:protein BZR1 homolog 4-like n=1 Tax=Impatiens glandulifera TaxID=253017 RepID=UPI001FB06C64|nr:protein BZR1 homolog 4-like [Impatiens glandulifera]
MQNQNLPHLSLSQITPPTKPSLPALQFILLSSQIQFNSMKESHDHHHQSHSDSTNSVGVIKRTAIEKEKTKMRERQRRSITTRIFHGLRKHGGYTLPPRADINVVLRELAKEAGWIVEPDGTTYRTTATTTTTASKGSGCSICPLCGNAGKGSAASTPSSSVIIGGGGGDCSTTASPRRGITTGDPVTAAMAFAGPAYLSFYNSIGFETSNNMNPLAPCMYRRLIGGNGVTPATFAVANDLAAAAASNHTSPATSPPRGS